jgi:general secretion pathway protein I|tara:strand:+ start:8596 stop:8949 length:354 start_codon:yes stop_codon:yes gene_type:complete
MVKKGFSLLEVGVALLILSLAVTAVFQFISSTTFTSLELQNRSYARQIANNRLALVETLEPLVVTNQRSGKEEFGGKSFFWLEKRKDASPDFFELSIRVGTSKDNTIYELRTFIEKR